MTIAPLPSLPVDLAVPGLVAAGSGTSAGTATGSGAGAGAAVDQVPTADSFAALVLAVLDAGAPAGEPTAVAAAPVEVPTGDDPAGPGAGPDTATGVPAVLQVGQVHSGPGTTAPTAEAGPTDPATDPALDPTVDPAVPVAVVPVPVTLPAALAAALGLSPVAAPASTPALAAAPEATGGQPVDLAHPTSSGPVVATAVAPAPEVVVPTAQAPAAPAGDPATAPATTAPAHESATAPATTAAAHESATAPAAAAPASATAPDTAPSPAVAQAAAVHQAARSTEPRTSGPRTASTDGPARTERTDSGTTADAPAPTLVQGPAAPAKVADQPTTSLTRAAAAQVVPELTRLVQAGPGTHRMVLRLDPEHLGEVRITLTVHPGGVRVRMATGTEDARAALTDGIATLQRALETVPGRPAGETQLAVLHRPQDAGASTTTHDGASPSAQGDAQASSHQTPGDRQQAGDRAAGRPAGTQVDITARDGSQDGGASGTPRPADPLPSFRSTRLDVSM